MNPNSAERNVRNTYHFYAGDNIGKRSPAALLDMLAEVASQTLHSEKELRTELSNTQTTTKPKTKLESGRKTQGTFFTVQQLLALPATQLVKQFTAFSSDELKRQYSYTCTLVPDCGQSYTSFASEGKARMSIKAHLAEHLEYLRNDKDAYSTFVATTSKYRKTKSNGGNKKSGKNQQNKKLQLETTNKENKVAVKLKNSMTPVTTSKVPDSKELPVVVWKEERKDEEKSIQEKSQKFEIRDAGVRVEGKVTHDLTVLDDHCYFEHSQKDGGEEGRLSFVSAMQDNLEPQSTPVTKNQIVLMVVQSDSVQMKEIRTTPEADHHIEEKVSINETQIYSQLEIPVWSEDQNVQNPLSEQGMMLSAKPKGKAKFIGTSKEEREMALALMERMKKKGNPTGGNLQCRICDPPRSFTALTTLVSHYRSHAGIKPYECRICRSVFTRRHSLKYHMLIHQNQTRFTCADCGKKFRHPSHFREHRRRHTGESPFGCGDCGQRFKTRNTYKRHLKTRHGKVLTTTGELVRISEEECQKVRANRKRKPIKPSVVEEENQREEETAVNEINADGNSTTTSESTIVYYNNNNYDNDLLPVTENGLESQEEVVKTEYANETEDILVRNNEVNNYNKDFDEKEIFCDATNNRLNNNTIGDENIENQQVQIEFLTKEHFQVDNQVIFYDNIREPVTDNFIRLHYKLQSDENNKSVDSKNTENETKEGNNVAIFNETKPISIIRNGKHSGILLLTKNNIPIINRIHSNCSSSNSEFPIIAIPQK